MDFESFNSGIESIKNILSMLKAGKDLLPQGPEKEEVTKKITEAEKAFLIAEAQSAKDLGYEICKCTWPPSIMTVDAETKKPTCPKCGNKDDFPVLHETEQIILTNLFNSGDRTVTQITSDLKIETNIVIYYLEELLKKSLIQKIKPIRTNQGISYGITHTGRGYFIKKGIRVTMSDE